MRKYFIVNLTINQLKRIESWYWKSPSSAEDIKLYEKIVKIRESLEGKYGATEGKDYKG